MDKKADPFEYPIIKQINIQIDRQTDIQRKIYTCELLAILNSYVFKNIQIVQRDIMNYLHTYMQNVDR